MNLVVVGTIGLDDIETPFGQAKSALGGSGSYASLAASYFVKPGLVSIAGKDLGAENKKKLSKVDLAGVTWAQKNFRWSGFYEYDMNEAQTKRTELNSLADFKPELPKEYRQAKFLLLGNIDPTLQMEVIRQMESKPFILLDTMNYWITSQRDNLLKVIKKVNFVVMNEGEARQLFDTPNLIKAGKELLKLGPDFAAIKKGEHGALLFSQEGFFSAPGYPLEDVKDPTGAGDSFAGGTMGYLAKKGEVNEINLRRAIIHGSAVASFCAEHFGLGYREKIKLNDIKERYEVFRQIRKF